jgi:phosphatidylcholine synthase
MLRKKTIAWLIHCYTASGAVLGMLALIAAARTEIRVSFALLFLAGFVDGTDGLLARRYKVAQILPKFSGAYLDNAVDVLTYIFVPIFIMGWLELLPSVYWIAVPTFAAMYAYGQQDMKTDDHYFLGFPSYWNVVALYMWWLRPGPVESVLFVSIPAILTFIPTRYLYPSRNTFLWRTTWALGTLWVVMCCWLLLQENPDRNLVLASSFYPLYYMGASFYLEYRLRQKHRRGFSTAALETDE